MKILTIKELATIIKVKEKTLYQWAESGQIPSIKLNGVLRFDQDDVLKWVSSCKKDPDSSYNPITQARSPRKGG
jgi:excisionase family DNA binding protein